MPDQDGTRIEMVRTRIEMVRDDAAEDRQEALFARVRQRYGWVPNTIRVMHAHTR
jgi:hypothetical protein